MKPSLRHCSCLRSSSCCGAVCSTNRPHTVHIQRIQNVKCHALRNAVLFLRFRKAGARAAGESVSAIVTVSSTTSPSGPLQSPRDWEGGPLIQCLDPVSASSSRPSKGPTPALCDSPSTQPSAWHGTAPGNASQKTLLPLYSFYHFILHFVLLTAPTTSSKDDSTVNVSALTICKHSSWTNWKKNTCTDKNDSHFLFLSVCKSIVIYCIMKTWKKSC